MDVCIKRTAWPVTAKVNRILTCHHATPVWRKVSQKPGWASSASSQSRLRLFCVTSRRVILYPQTSAKSGNARRPTAYSRVSFRPEAVLRWSSTIAAKATSFRMSPWRVFSAGKSRQTVSVIVMQPVRRKPDGHPHPGHATKQHPLEQCAAGELTPHVKPPRLQSYQPAGSVLRHLPDVAATRSCSAAPPGQRHCCSPSP